MSHLDDVIRSDLSALCAETARALPDIAALRADLLGAGSPYRDGGPGAKTGRRAGLEQRLRDLALLPAACERVFVHRVSRAAAGAAVLLSVAFAAVASTDPWTRSLIALFFGRPTAPLFASLLCCAALGAYVVAGLVTERYYERRMRAGLDPDAAGSVAEARRLLRRVDAAAIALPLAGVVCGGLLLGLLVFFSDPGYSALALVAGSRSALVPALWAGVAAALVLGHACSRERRRLGRSPLIALAEHWITLVAGGAAVVVALWYAARTAFGLHALDIIPDRVTAWRLGVVGLAALILPAAWALLWLRRREQKRLGG